MKHTEAVRLLEANRAKLLDMDADERIDTATLLILSDREPMTKDEILAVLTDPTVMWLFHSYGTGELN